MAEITKFPETGQYKLKEVRVRLREGEPLYSRTPITSAGDALALMRREMAQYDREVLLVINFNNRMQPINFHVVSVGDISQSVAGIPNILKTGILSNASSFMLLHNHPSGDVTPSGPDIMTTRRVIEAGKLLGIPCVDHIIVGGETGMYFSMREQGTADFDEEHITMTAEEILRVAEKRYKQEETASMAERIYQGADARDERGTVPREETYTATDPRESPYSAESFDPGRSSGQRDGQAYPDRRDRLKEITDQLEAGVKEYMANDVQFKKVLETMAKFHHYSANNVLLIAMQMPNATRVASYGSWKRRFNRQVMKGQKGLSIIAPAPYKDRRQREVLDSRTGLPVMGADGKPLTEEVIVTIPRYKVEKVFDVSQTTGEPLPELDVPELIGDAEHFQDFLDALTAISPVPIRFADIEGGAKGYYHTVDKEIVIQKGMSESQTLKTLVHEVSHARLHDRDIMKAEGVTKSQQQKELEAESIAYTVLSHYHMDTSGYSIPYLASWSGSQDTKQLRACMDTIRRTAGEIIDEIDAFMAERMKERDMEKGAQDVSDGKAEKQQAEERREMQAEPAGGKLTFFVAECMEFPVMGEYHGDLSLIEALKLYMAMPDGQMGGKGIGFTIQDGPDHFSSLALVASGRVQEEVINGIESLRLNPDVQAAIAEAKVYFPGLESDRANSERVDSDRKGSERTEHAVREDPTAEREKPASERSRGNEKADRSPIRKDRSEKRESVLADLKETQKQLHDKGKEKAKAPAARRKKGEQAL